MKSNYLNSVIKQFQYYQLLGDKTLAALNADELYWQYDEESNSIAIIVKHINGNMLSRWTDFLTSDGEKEWRNREGEFVETKLKKEDLITLWEEGWGCLFAALTELTLKEESFDKTIYIRNMGHTVVEAVNRQLAHYAYHVGQMVFLGKMIKGKEWKSLSIPKGDSASFNKKKFAQEKHKEHFTEQFLKEKKE